MLNKVVDYLKQPSTHAGLAAMLTAGASFAPYPYSWIMLSAAAMLGGAAVVIPEKGRQAAPPPPAAEPAAVPITAP